MIESMIESMIRKYEKKNIVKVIIIQLINKTNK